MLLLLRLYSELRQITQIPIYESRNQKLIIIKTLKPQTPTQKAVLLYTELHKIKREKECLIVVELITSMTQMGKIPNPETEHLES